MAMGTYPAVECAAGDIVQSPRLGNWWVSSTGAGKYALVSTNGMTRTADVALASGTAGSLVGGVVVGPVQRGHTTCRGFRSKACGVVLCW
jgi:hypothetical protein